MYHYSSIHLNNMRSLLISFLVLLIMFCSVTPVSAEDMSESPQLSITVVYNNVPYQPGLTTDWGFSCIIEGLGKTILFDTGADGDLLLANMKRLGVKAETVDAVFFSLTTTATTPAVYHVS